MRKAPAPLLVLALLLAITGCGPVEGGGRLSDGTNCVEYTYSNVVPPTATTVVGVTVWPCPKPTTAPPSLTPTTTVPRTTTTTPPAVTTTTTPPAVTTTTPPATASFPNRGNTGVPAGVSLDTVNGDLTVSTANAVVDAKNVTGSVYIRANGVVVKNSRIAGAVTNSFQGWNFTLQDSEVGGSGCTGITNGGVGVGSENYTVMRSYIHGFADGPRDSGSNITVRDSLITICEIQGAHGDGIQGYGGGSNVHIIHNTIDARIPGNVTSAVFMADDSVSAYVRNNLLMGGGYVLRLHNDLNNAGSNWAATGNRIVANSWRYAATFNTNVCGRAGFQWSDNKLVTIDANYNVTTIGADVGC